MILNGEDLLAFCLPVDQVSDGKLDGGIVGAKHAVLN